MKKIISLVLTVVVALACLTPVSFATANPTMNVAAVKITDFSGSYADYADYADMGLDIYEVTFTATGIAMTTTVTANLAKKLSGDSIIGASIKFDTASTAVKDEEWMAEQFEYILTPSAAAWSGDTYAVAMAGTAPLYPAPKTAATVTADMESPALYKMIFMIDPTQPVTMTFKECAVNIGTFNQNTMTGATTYTMDNGTLAMSQATLTLPVAETPATVDVTSVTISGATNATVGDNVSLTATVLPDNATDKTVTWTKVSGNGAVSSDSGVVTATAAGDVVVKATAGGVDSANYTVTFAPATVDVTSVTISGATAATVGDNVSLTATVLPDNATDKTVTWTKVSGNGAVSDSGVVTATAAGDVVVKATAGGVDSANYTVSFAAAAPADIVPTAADKDTYSNASTGLQDAFGNSVTIDSSRSYGAAKFENVVLDDGEYVYKVFATGINKTSGLEETKSWDVVDGSVEITGANVSFIAIVRSATHTITSVVLRAFAK